MSRSLGRCDRCGSHLVDDQGDSWPYCDVCGWCPECGDNHPTEPDRRADVAAVVS